MTQMLVPNDGAKGIDIDTGNGVRKLDADKAGRITVDDPKLAKVLRSEGFAVTGLASGFRSEGFPCECGHQSLFKKCGKCGRVND